LTLGAGLCSDGASSTPTDEKGLDMEAVIATGGKQYRVAPGQLISIEKVPGEKGSAVEFRSVLLVTRDGEVIAGEKALSRAKVSGEVVAQGRRRKVMVVKFKRRKNYRRNRGHRQAATTVRITTIEV
jgi:large subunit ribosomal protein L21